MRGEGGGEGKGRGRGGEGWRVNRAEGKREGRDAGLRKKAAKTDPLLVAEALIRQMQGKELTDHEAMLHWRALAQQGRASRLQPEGLAAPGRDLG